MSWDDDRKAKQGEEDARKKAAEEQSKAQADDLIAKLGTALDAKLKPFNDKLAEFDGRFQKLESNTAKPETKSGDDDAIPSVMENEDAAFAKRLGPVVINQIKLQARLIETEAMNDLSSRGFGQYAADVRGYLDKTPLETKAKNDYDGYCRNVVTMVIGQKALSKGLKLDDKQEFFIEDASGNSSKGATHELSSLVADAADGRIEVVKGQGPEAVESFLRDKLKIDPEKFMKAQVH